MLTAGFTSHMVSDWFGLDRIEQFTIRFQVQLFPGDTITMTGEITEVDDGNTGTIVTADLKAKTGNGNAVLSGETIATLPPE